ncbi:MAG: guanylate kinase [Gammaproteobacteria bacterium]|nr:MAG: guanylate kinase [Gammaproteobacteria bacterium]
MAKLIVISAPSGAGKTSLIAAFLEKIKNQNFILSISFTTRPKRENEKHGESYFFIDKQKFKKMIENNDFLEFAEVFGDFKGTSKSWVKQKLSENMNVILELDWQGANQVKEIYSDAKTIFILPPSYAELELRLNSRGLDKIEEIQKRLGEARKEIENGKSFDYLVVNDDFKSALEDLKNIIIDEKELVEKRKSLVKDSIKALLEE